MIEKDPILITGCIRSGASVIAATINLCGAFGGRMSKRGMFCNDRIRETVVKPYLLHIGADPEGQWPLPFNKSIQEDWREQVKYVMIKEGYVSGPWMYKDSRIGLTWSLWNYAFPNAKWIIVRRRTGDVIQSCVKTAYMEAFKDPYKRGAVGVETEEAGWLWWVHQNEKNFVEMIEAGVNCKQIWPERMIHGDYQQIHEVCEWVGVTWKDEALDFINPLLWGGKQERRNV